VEIDASKCWANGEKPQEDGRVQKCELARKRDELRFPDEKRGITSPIRNEIEGGNGV
jgi:hypothetical protein